MIWLPVHTDLPRNIKLKRFSQLLNIKQAQAVGHLVMLWLWTLEVAPKGSLQDFTDAEIAEGAGWTKRDKGVFVAALIEAGFLEYDYRIHDWEDYAGGLLLKRETDRLRKREERLRVKKMQERIDEDFTAEEGALSDGRPA